ncbi:hypothetical protein Tco_1029870 [Tanacetum coccineum]|uniref:Uncharacterized protein n=1 Tax=Tanacetum coccineum TaxID=301880 RepID=A0ABQ5G4S3_9ASTR
MLYSSCSGIGYSDAGSAVPDTAGGPSCYYWYCFYCSHFQAAMDSDCFNLKLGMSHNLQFLTIFFPSPVSTDLNQLDVLFGTHTRRLNHFESALLPPRSSCNIVGCEVIPLCGMRQLKDNRRALELFLSERSSTACRRVGSSTLRRRMNRYFSSEPSCGGWFGSLEDVNSVVQSLHSDDVVRFLETQDEWVVSMLDSYWKLLLRDVAASFDSAVHRVHAVSFDAAVASIVSAACCADCGEDCWGTKLQTDLSVVFCMIGIKSVPAVVQVDVMLIMFLLVHCSVPADRD